MELALLDGFQDESTKIAQGQTTRRAQVAAEFSSPLVEGLLFGLAAKGLKIKHPKKLLSAAGVGAAHGVYRKTKQYAG